MARDVRGRGLPPLDHAETLTVELPEEGSEGGAAPARSASFTRELSGPSSAEEQEYVRALMRIRSVGTLALVEPDNVMFQHTRWGEPRVRLLDFGIAGLRHDSRRLTRTGKVVGSPDYMAPESLTGAPARASQDVYSLGAFLHFLLTGRPPERGVRADLESSLPGDIPGLPKVVACCLEPGTLDRYPSGMEALEALRGLSTRSLGDGAA